MAIELYQDFSVRISDCDPTGKMRPASLLVEMQELAEAHSAQLGFSREHLIANGIVWILYRQHAVMYEYPAFGDAVRLITWPGKIEGPLFPRYFRLERANGRCLGEMVTSWVLVNIHTRRPMRPSALPGEFPANEERTSSLALPGMLRIEDAQPAHTRAVQYSDLDVNQHMNNTRYLDWVCDLLPLDAMLKGGLERWQLNYISEAKAGENLRLLSIPQGRETLVQGKGADGRTVFEASVSVRSQ